MNTRQRTNHQFILYNAQTIYVRALYEPETQYKNQPLQKPQYSVTLRFPKTRASWHEEAQLARLAEVIMTIWRDDYGGVAQNWATFFPIKDGDLPNETGKVPTWAAGHWTLRPTTDRGQPDVSGIPVQGGEPVKMTSLGLPGLPYTDGSFACVAMAGAKRMSGNPGVKLYLNSVLFTGAGPAVQVGAPSIDWKDAFAKAQQAGIMITTGGHSAPSPAGPSPFGGAPVAQNPFAQSGPAPSGGPALPPATAPFQTGNSGTAVSPFSPQPQPVFVPPQNPNPFGGGAPTANPFAR